MSRIKLNIQKVIDNITNSRDLENGKRESHDVLQNPQETKDISENRYIKVGEILKEARENHGITIEYISSETKIRPECLIMLENGDYDGISKITYYYGCVKLVAKIVGLPIDNIVDYLIDVDEDYVFAINQKDTKQTTQKGNNKKSNQIQSYHQQTSQGNRTTTDRKLTTRKNFLILGAILLLLLLISKLTSKSGTQTVGDRFLAESGYEVTTPTNKQNNGVYKTE